MKSVQTASIAARGLLRTAEAADQLLDQIRYELMTSILPQRDVLIEALKMPTTLRQQVDTYIYEDVAPLRDFPTAVTNFAAAAIDMAQLEDSLVDLRRAISWSAKYSGFNWWIRRRQVELSICEFIVIPGPGSARDFLIERESSVAKSFESLERANVLDMDAVNSDAIARIRLLTVPQVDGASAKWHPISLGHELAHLKFDLRWLEVHLAQASAATAPARAVKAIAQRPPSAGPALQSWYVQLRSWLIETACDAALLHFYGQEGLQSLTSYLTSHSDVEDGPEHPSPGLRLAVLNAKNRSNLDPFKEPLSASPAGRERKAAYTYFALGVRDRARSELKSGFDDVNSSNRVLKSATASLEEGTPPNALDWPTMSIVDSPSSVESGLVRSLWPNEDVQERRLKRDDVKRAAFRQRKVDFAVDFLQFAHRFEAARRDGGVTEREAERGRLLNVLFISKDGVRGSSGQTAGRTSMDVRLGRHFIVFKRNEISTLNPLDASVQPSQIQEFVEIGWGNSFVLHPGEMVLAVTLESVVLDRSCNAQVLSRSSWGRMGLLSATAVHVQPTFRGTLTLELVNLASVPLRLSPGQRIAQLVPIPACGEADEYDGKYMDQDWRPQFSAATRDWEFGVLRSMRDS